MKLLTKFPKNGILPHDDGQIYINHAKFDINLKATYVYCISSLKANSHGEYTKIFPMRLTLSHLALGQG
jgi:hypothetical protein